MFRSIIISFICSVELPHARTLSPSAEQDPALHTAASAPPVYVLNKSFWEVQCDAIGLTKVPAAGIQRPGWNQRQAEAGNRMLVKMREYSDKVRASNKPKVSLLADWTRAGLHPLGFP